MTTAAMSANINFSLLKRFLGDYPFQPATALWRSIEIGRVLAYPFPEGLGLDLGCGDGHLTKIILEQVGERDLVGIDIDPQETVLAKSYDFYQRIHTIKADNIPETDATFDFIFSNSVLEHIENIEAVLGEVARVLKPGGIFLFTVPGDEFHDCLLGSVFPWVSRKTYLQELDRRVAHQRYWSEENWKNILDLHHLKIERVEQYLTKAEIRRWENISRLTAGVLYGLFGKRKNPIEIQRTLGLRNANTKLSNPFLINLIAQIITFNLKTESTPDRELNGCLMIQARKSENSVN
ncbi:class I SAM-dependent methyltransferase [Lusitaniella coriacea]|uniref:class I SAM-dependent methyltransferase n=1 Tax=Lusitaniella coriacea TaxID=1983105 RepID=UPI003CEDC5EB